MKKLYTIISLSIIFASTNGMQRLDNAKFLYSAIKRFNNEDVRQLIENDRALINIYEINLLQSGFLGEGVALHYAAYVGNHVAVDLLLQNGANSNVVTETSKRTPLHLAGSKEVVDILIKAGAEVNKKDAKGNPPLYTIFDYLPLMENMDHYLTSPRYCAVSRLVGFAESVNKPLDEDNNTLLHKSVLDRRHCYIRTKFFLDHGAHHSLVNNKGETAYSLVFYGMSRAYAHLMDEGSVEILKLLLDDKKYNHFTRKPIVPFLSLYGCSPH